MVPNEMRMLTGEHLVSEAEDYRSRETGTVDGGVAPGLAAGTLLGKLTATGVYVRYDPTANTGAETLSGVLFEETVGEAERTIHVRACQVTKAHLTYSDGADAAAITAADDALVALGIIPRA